MAENRSSKGMRAGKWATDENRREIISTREQTCGCTMTSNQMKIYIYVRKYKLIFSFNFH
jgi:hypothetical protein